MTITVHGYELPLTNIMYVTPIKKQSVVDNYDFYIKFIGNDNRAGFKFIIGNFYEPVNVCGDSIIFLFKTLQELEDIRNKIISYLN